MVISKLIKLPKHVAGLIGRLLGVAAAATDCMGACVKTSPSSADNSGTNAAAAAADKVYTGAVTSS